MPTNGSRLVAAVATVLTLIATLLAISVSSARAVPGAEAQDDVEAQITWQGPWTWRNDNSNKCMEILGSSTAHGARAVQNTCVTGRRTQQWYLGLVIATDGYNGYQIRNVHSGLCLIPLTSERGAEVVQWPCNSSWNRIWWTDNSTFKGWRNDVTSFYLEVQGGSKANSAKVVSWTWHGRAHQRWSLWDV